MSAGRALVEGGKPTRVWILSIDDKWHKVYSQPGPPKAIRTEKLSNHARYGPSSKRPNIKVFEGTIIEWKEI